MNNIQKIKSEYYTLVSQEWGNLLHERLDGNVSGQMSKSNLIIAFIWNFIELSLLNQRKELVEEIRRDTIKEIWKLNRDTVGYMTLPRNWGKYINITKKS